MHQPRNFYTAEQDAMIRRMHKLSFSAAEIAERLKRTEKGIRQRCAYLGLSWGYTPGTSILMGQAVDHAGEKRAELIHRQQDKKFQRLLAEAILRGDNLPAGQPKPLRLIG